MYHDQNTREHLSHPQDHQTAASLNRAAAAEQSGHSRSPGSSVEAHYGDTCAALQGIHYPEHSRPDALPLVHAGMTVSTAFHELRQLQLDWGTSLDYAFLSPILDSISKTGYKAAFTVEELRPALTKCAMPIIALGGALKLLWLFCEGWYISVCVGGAFMSCCVRWYAGIEASRLASLQSMGFAGAAMLGAVWSSSDPVATLVAAIAECHRLQIDQAQLSV